MMAFIKSNNTVLSFAEYQDVVDADQRLFEENEGLTDDVVEDATIRASERILSLLKNTNWYRELALSLGASALSIPNLSAGKIIARKNDFTDLPKVADFGNEQNAELVKIAFYRDKFTRLFDELLLNGDWYDYDSDSVLNANEYKPYPTNYQRVR